MIRGGAYKFTSKKQSEKGIMSTALALISLASFFAANVISFRAKGEITSRIGAAGFISLILALAALVLGVMSLGESDVFRLFPRLGTTLSILSCILWGLIIMIGVG